MIFEHISVYWGYHVTRYQDPIELAVNISLTWEGHWTTHKLQSLMLQKVVSDAAEYSKVLDGVATIAVVDCILKARHILKFCQDTCFHWVKIYGTRT